MSKPEATQDFMAVESFSQLPFSRPPPPPPPSSSSSSAIRLFGIDVPHDDSSSNSNSGNSSTKESSNVVPIDTIRRFECHYCCRNFPTSQALGGHQNAHKRERQHAKRAHLQSTLAAARGHYHYRLHAHPASATPLPTHHYYAAPPRAGLGSLSQPITGSPLPGLWRVPNALILRDQPTPRLQPLNSNPGGNFSSLSPSSFSYSSSSPSPRSASEPASARVAAENLSLDLHL